MSRNLTPFKTQTVHIEPAEFISRPSTIGSEARRANCDTSLKDVSSFVSEKMEEDRQSPHPSRRQPNSRRTPRSSHIDRGKISMGDCPSRRKSTMEHRGKSTMEQNTASQAIQRQHTASNGQKGKDLKLKYHSRRPSSERFIMKEAKMPKSDSNDSFQDPQPKQRRRVTDKDTNRVVADRATD